MEHFRNIVRKYLTRNEDTLFSDNIIHEMNGVVLYDTNVAIFEFFGVMIDEVHAYLKKQNITPDKIVFVSLYDIEVQNAKRVNVKMEADSNISVIEEDGLLIARICICEKIAIKEDHRYGA